MKRVIIYDSLRLNARTARMSFGFKNGKMMLWPVNDETEEYRFRLTFLDGDCLYREADVLSSEYSNYICEIYIHDDKAPINPEEELCLYAVCIEFPMDNKNMDKKGRFEVINTCTPVYFKDYKKAMHFATRLIANNRENILEVLIIKLNGKKACEFKCSASYFRYPLGVIFHWNKENGIIYDYNEVE